MGSKKKVASFMEEEVEVAEGTEVNGLGEKMNSKKKMKKKRKMKSDDGQTEEGSDAPSTPSPSSTKPMERKKKRKMLDKDRHRVASESKEKSPKQETSQVKMEEDEGVSSNSNGLPAFHVSVFSDLASVDASKREAAAERLAMELLEVQKAYDEVGNREAFQSGFQLEAAKDDGLDDCAPSVRYAVRRLVRGVSSSREVFLISLFYFYLCQCSSASSPKSEGVWASSYFVFFGIDTICGAECYNICWKLSRF